PARTHQERRNTALLQQTSAADARGDAAPFFPALAPDIRFGIAGPPAHFRFAGVRRGVAWAQRVLAEIAEDLEWREFELRELIAERDRVIALTGGRLRDRATGVGHAVRLVDGIRPRRRRIPRFLGE